MEFVTFEIAKKLKEKGFREKCFATYTPYNETLKLNEINTDKRPASYILNIEEFRECYNYYKDNNIDTPTISQVSKWLIDEKNIYIEIFLYNRKYSYLIKSTTKICEDDLFHECLNDDTSDDEYEDPEDAMLAGIKYVLDNLI